MPQHSYTIRPMDVLDRSHFGYRAELQDGVIQGRHNWLGTTPPDSWQPEAGTTVGDATCMNPDCGFISYRWLATSFCPYCGLQRCGCGEVHDEDLEPDRRQSRLDAYRAGSGRLERTIFDRRGYPQQPAPSADNRRLYRGDLEPYGRTTAVNFFGKGPLYVGAEIELHADWRAAYHPSSIPMLAAAKSDSSLCRTGGEIVTHPIDLDYWHSKGEKHMSRFFGSLSNDAICQRRESCAGLHFHLSADALKARGVWSLLYLHASIGRKLGELGGRGRGSHWGSFARMTRPSMRNAQLKVAYDGGGWAEPGERYSAVNLNRRGTVELRYMAGATDFATFAYRWELAHALGSLAVDGPAMRRLISQDRKSVAFASWIRQHERQYPNLKAEIDRRNWRGVA